MCIVIRNNFNNLGFVIVRRLCWSLSIRTTFRVRLLALFWQRTAILNGCLAFWLLIKFACCQLARWPVEIKNSNRVCEQLQGCNLHRSGRVRNNYVYETFGQYSSWVGCHNKNKKTYDFLGINFSLFASLTAHTKIYSATECFQKLCLLLFAAHYAKLSCNFLCFFLSISLCQVQWATPKPITKSIAVAKGANKSESQKVGVGAKLACKQLQFIKLRAKQAKPSKAEHKQCPCPMRLVFAVFQHN